MLSGRSRQYLLVLGALAIAARLAGVEAIPNFTGTPAVGDLLEWRLQGAPVQWLGNDCARTPVLEVAAPDGSVVRRSAFLARDYREDGKEFAPVAAAELRIRHVARVAGKHTWVLRAPDGGEAAHGSCTIAPAAAPTGPIRISADNQRLLAFADGTPFIAIGPNICWASPPDRMRQFERWFSALEAAGGNHLRLWCASWSGQIESDAPDAYRLDHAWLLDQILSSARKHHLRVTLVIDNHHDFITGACVPCGADYEARTAGFFAAKPAEQYQRRLRYLLARYGADDAIAVWELFNELDIACPVRKTAVAWVQGATELFGSLDVDHRLRSVSWTAGDWQVLAPVRSLDLLQIHAYVLEWVVASDAVHEATRDGVGMLEDHAARANRLDRPFCFSEVGYQGRQDDNPGNDLDERGFLLRQQAWAGLLLGGYGTGMGWWWDVYIDRDHLWDRYKGLARTVGRIDWRDHNLRPLEPNQGSTLRVLGWLAPRQALLWPQIRNDTWYNALKQRQPRPWLTRPAQLHLAGLQPSTNFSIQRVGMADGEIQSTVEGKTDAGGQLALTAPEDCLDIVFWIQAK